MKKKYRNLLYNSDKLHCCVAMNILTCEKQRIEFLIFFAKLNYAILLKKHNLTLLFMYGYLSTWIKFQIVKIFNFCV